MAEKTSKRGKGVSPTQFGSPDRDKILTEQRAKRKALTDALDTEFERLEKRGPKMTQRDVLDGLTASFLRGGGFDRLGKIIRKSDTSFIKVTELFLKHKVPLNSVLELDVKGNFLKIPPKNPSPILDIETKELN